MLQNVSSAAVVIGASRAMGVSVRHFNQQSDLGSYLVAAI